MEISHSALVGRGIDIQFAGIFSDNEQHPSFLSKLLQQKGPEELGDENYYLVHAPYIKIMSPRYFYLHTSSIAR